jgi:hypothetical protein
MKAKTKKSIKTADTRNFYLKLLEKKFHSSENVRSQIAEIKKGVRDIVLEEPLKSFSVSFQGEVVGNSFEKTLKIVSKHLFHKGKVDNYKTVKKLGIVEANITASQTELEELIKFLMKRHLVLHCKKGIPKGASNMLIIDEEEENQLNDFTPDSIDCNYVSTAQTSERFTGRVGGYLILNGLPLTTKTLGSELRFNEIVTTNKVFTSTGIKEVFLNLHFITSVLMLDLEQHYFQLRVFNAQEEDLKKIEDNIDNLGLFTELFEHITNENNPLLFNNELFMDVIKLERIVEQNNWKALPAYDSYVYSATDRLNAHFKFLEEYGLFLEHAENTEKTIEALDKKLSKHSSSYQKEQDDLSENYHELKKLNVIPKNQLFKNDYLEMLNSFRKLLAYIDSMSIQNTVDSSMEEPKKKQLNPAKPPKGLVATLKERAKALLSSASEPHQKPSTPHEEPTVDTELEEEALSLLSQVKERLRKISKLKTTSGEDAYLDARKKVPFLTNLSDALDLLKKLIKDIQKKKDIDTQFKDLFNKKNRFVMLFNKLDKLVKFKNKQEQEKVRGFLTNLEELLHDKPLKENSYEKIIDNSNNLEAFVNTKDVSSMKMDNAVNTLSQEISQDKTYNIILNIRNCIQNVIDKKDQIRELETFKNDREFLSFSVKELNGFLDELIKFHKKLKVTKYYDDKSNYEKVEKEFDKLIVKANDIEIRLSSMKRSESNTISKESEPSIDYLKCSMLNRKNLEKTIIFAQFQINQAFGFIKTIKDFLDQDSFVHSGVSTSDLFDQITYLLSNTDVKLLDFTSLTEDMYNDSIKSIFQYQVGETFNEPKKADIDNLMKKVEKLIKVKTYER